MSNSKIVSIVAAIAAALSFLAAWHWTGTEAATITTWTGIASALVAGVNQELHTATQKLTWLGFASIAVAAFTQFQTALPSFVPLILGVAGSALAMVGAPVANATISASEAPK